MNWPIFKPWLSPPRTWELLGIVTLWILAARVIGGEPTVVNPQPRVNAAARSGAGATYSAVGPHDETVADVPPFQLRQPTSMAADCAVEAGKQGLSQRCCPPCKVPDGCLWWPGKWLGRCWIAGLPHLGKPWPVPALLRHSGGQPRHQGKGEPLVGTSWLNRPYYVGWFLGPMFGDNPVGGMDHENNAFGGFYLGWDFDHYWGTQLRFGWASLGLTDPRVPGSRYNDDVFLADLSLLYYPWGDTRWRPYLLLGMGSAGFSFADSAGVGHDTTLFALPFGGGVKYQFRRWMAVRAEVLDNVAFASEGLKGMHNVSLILGVEAHWGGTPKSYWPWHPGPHIW